MIPATRWIRYAPMYRGKYVIVAVQSAGMPPPYSRVRFTHPDTGEVEECEIPSTNGWRETKEEMPRTVRAELLPPLFAT